MGLKILNYLVEIANLNQRGSNRKILAITFIISFIYCFLPVLYSLLPNLYYLLPLWIIDVPILNWSIGIFYLFKMSASRILPYITQCIFFLITWIVLYFIVKVIFIQFKKGKV